MAGGRQPRRESASELYLGNQAKLDEHVLMRDRCVMFAPLAIGALRALLLRRSLGQLARKRIERGLHQMDQFRHLIGCQMIEQLPGVLCLSLPGRVHPYSRIKSRP